jgi:hypothetical protein
MLNLFFTMLDTCSSNLLNSSIAASWDYLAADKSTMFTRGGFPGAPIIWPDGAVRPAMGAV